MQHVYRSRDEENRDGMKNDWQKQRKCACFTDMQKAKCKGRLIACTEKFQTQPRKSKLCRVGSKPNCAKSGAVSATAKDCDVKEGWREENVGKTGLERGKKALGKNSHIPQQASLPAGHPA